MFKGFIKIVLLVILTGQAYAQGTSGTFKTAQLNAKRVKKAYESRYADLKLAVSKAGLDINKIEVYLRIFKKEKELQVWMRNKGDAKFSLFKTYPICASSGELGPKRREGDGQVPEGFYEIESFNPASSYHLSMKVNYPNASDLIKKDAGKRTGGDIMIHGNCVTIGCVPIEDGPIEELYILCVEAKDHKSKIRSDIFPCKFSKENMNMLNANYSKEKNLFWEPLKEAYVLFEQKKEVPDFKVDKNGNYTITK